MKERDDNLCTETLAIVFVSLEVTSKDRTRALTIKDIAYFLDDCLMERDAILLGEDKPVAPGLSPPKENLH